MNLERQLSELFVLRNNALADASVASKWVLCIHDAFYMTKATVRRTSKFLEMETKLVQTFEELSAGDESDFWVFAVLVVLQLAQETPQRNTSDRKKDMVQLVGTETEKPMDKKTKKRSQPYAPLAFMVINALRKLTEGEGKRQQLRHCHIQGNENQALRDFCVHGLQDSTFVDQKLVVEIMALFAITDINPQAVRDAAQSLLASKKYTGLIKLCTIFSSLDWSFASTVRTMTKWKDWSAAELLARTFGESDNNELAKVLVDEAIAIQDVKRAHRIVNNFGLQEEYPDIDLQYCHDGLMKLIERQRWQMALAFAGNDLSLQKLLFDHMVAAGEIQWASRLAQILAIPDFDAQVADMIAKRERIVGLDVEWKPTSSKIAAATGSKTTSAMASILQISSSSRVFVIDLLALQDNDFLFETLLGRLFADPFLLKVGFGFDTDLKVLHQTFPERSSLINITPFLELSAVVSKLLGVSVGNSLSNATSTILGSPLDKRMQMSNWDVRPLTEPQLTYAALDAYCLVQITNKLRKNEDTKLPPWEATAAEIHELAYPSPLTNEETVEAISLRNKYHKDWVKSRKKPLCGDVVANLLTPQDVEGCWEERKRKHQENELKHLQTGAGADQEILDTALTFLDPLTVRNLLKQSRDSEQPATFIAVNAICFFADEEPCVACIEANCKLDTAQLAMLCGVSRRRIKLATPAECCDYFGFEPGTIPPFGHREQSDHRVRIYASSTLQHVKSLVCGGGSHESLLWLNSKAYFALIDIETVGDIQRGVSAVESINEQATKPPARQERKVSIREYKFLADSMVARVGKWLRTIGMDVIIWDPYSVPKKTASQDHKAALLALSVCEQRILLTRDKKLANRRDAGACFVVSSDDPFKQFQEIKTHFALKLVKDEMMSRCSRCNAKGFDVVDLDYVRNQTEDEVHPNVLEVVTEFWVCRVCHKIYWEGPKYDSNYANLLRMFDEDSIVDSVSKTDAIEK
ncbi:Exonuclease mut-7 [Phytophthora nicotianae]|uniref:Exonuclease mut-7 n=1 Tax=Phytophthora nicotianae TaxID=4792 RepID=A0A0W8DYM7_PHYNI|nr:Exonuclease mut-7 [Phytophthora nicotianae]